MWEPATDELYIVFINITYDLIISLLLLMLKYKKSVFCGSMKATFDYKLLVHTVSFIFQNLFIDLIC